MEFRKPDRKQQKFWEQASYLYQSQMDQNTRSYLHGRGLSDQTIAYFRLGLVADPVKGHEIYAGRLCIPYIKKLATVALKFRCLKDHDCGDVPGHAKYLCDGEQWLFNTADADFSDSLSLAEGEFDAMILHQAGLPAVGIPGVKSWAGHPYWKSALGDPDEIYMFADNDTSKKENYGHELARRIKADLPRTRIITLPDDHDVNETYLEFGPKELFERAGIPWTESYSDESSQVSSLRLVSA